MLAHVDAGQQRPCGSGAREALATVGGSSRGADTAALIRHLRTLAHAEH
ncbi:hypothetical protein [Streptomyces sp. NPDC048191]